ncbi:MAG: hypothetical protein ACR2NB_14595 [Solirubrobacteraceae bacterium]
MAEDVDNQLEWERRRRSRFSLAAIAAALLPLAAGIANAVVYNDAPRASLLTSLERAVSPGPIGDLPSLHLPLYVFYQDNFALLLAIALLNALGLLATGAVLTFLGKAVRARRPQFRPYAVHLPLIAGALFALSGLVLVVATNLAVSSLLDGPRTVSAVSDWQAGVLTAGRWLEGLSRLLLGVGFVLVSLNAMRTGLLTRFLGALGVIAGGLLVLPLGGPLPVVQAFWLVALAISIGHRFPGAVAPAWRTGRAEPWPSQQSLREARYEAETSSADAGDEAAVAKRDGAQGAPSGAVPARSSRRRRRR